MCGSTVAMPQNLKVQCKQSEIIKKIKLHRGVQSFSVNIIIYSLKKLGFSRDKDKCDSSTLPSLQHTRKFAVMSINKINNFEKKHHSKPNVILLF